MQLFRLHNSHVFIIQQMLHFQLFTITWTFKKSRSQEYSYNLSIVILYISWTPFSYKLTPVT